MVFDLGSGFWMYKSPYLILQSLPANQFYCTLAVTPGVLVTHQRRWSPKIESLITETRHTEKLHMKSKKK